MPAPRARSWRVPFPPPTARPSAMTAAGGALFDLCFVASWLGAAAVDVPTCHGTAMRTGWIEHDQAPLPQHVAGGSFGELWQSPELDWVDGQPPRLYATPLYLDEVEVAPGSFPATRCSVIFAATSNGYVYAINAFATPQAPAGAILWRTSLVRLTKPTFDGINIGVISTPVIDRTKKILYVSSCATAES